MMQHSFLKFVFSLNSSAFSFTRLKQRNSRITQPFQKLSLHPCHSHWDLHILKVQCHYTHALWFQVNILGRCYSTWHSAVSEVSELASDINIVLLHAQHKPSSISHGQQVVPQCPQILEKRLKEASSATGAVDASLAAHLDRLHPSRIHASRSDGQQYAGPYTHSFTKPKHP